MIPIRDIAGGASFAVRVQPRAKRNAVAGTMGDALKLALTSPPVEGRANEACIEFLARLLGVPRSSIQIASGETSRNKVIRVLGLSARSGWRAVAGPRALIAMRQAAGVEARAMAALLRKRRCGSPVQ